MSFTVGFVDYNLNNFHANKFLDLLRGELQAHGVEVTCAYGMETGSSKAWAEEKGVVWAESPEEVAQRADGVLILAPNNAEVHLELLEKVVHAGKPVYVDKTFADSIVTAKNMIRLAEQHGIPMFSTSALRFTPSLQEFMNTEAASKAIDAACQGPNQWYRYGVHAVEPVLTLFGPKVKRLRAFGQEKLLRVDLEWHDGRTGHITVNGYGGMQFGMRVTTPTGSQFLDLNDARYYTELMKRIIEFFKTGNSPVPLEETLMVVTILEKAQVSRAADGAWIEL